MRVEEILMAIISCQQGGNQMPAIAADAPVAVMGRLHGEHVESDPHETTSLSSPT
jgi:hypothetical protein